MEMVGGALSTVTLIAAAVVVFPAASRATAVKLCEPLLAVVVFQETAYGAVVSSAFKFTPSSLNCTPTTPTLSVALALTVTVPLTEASAAGAVMDTVGGVVSFVTVTLIAAEVAVFPAASRATAVSVCTALLAVVVFHERVYGAVVTSAPRFTPSSLNCTPTTPTLSVAFAETVIVPATEAPEVGEEMEMVGGLLSTSCTVTVGLVASRWNVLLAKKRTS